MCALLTHSDALHSHDLLSSGGSDRSGRRDREETKDAKESGKKRVRSFVRSSPFLILTPQPRSKSRDPRSGRDALTAPSPDTNRRGALSVPGDSSEDERAPSPQSERSERRKSLGSPAHSPLVPHHQAPTPIFSSTPSPSSSASAPPAVVTFSPGEESPSLSLRVPHSPSVAPSAPFAPLNNPLVPNPPAGPTHFFNFN